MFLQLILKINTGTLGDRPKPMTIQLDSDFSVGCRCHWVTDADLAVGDRLYRIAHAKVGIGYIISLSY